nr:zinc finger, CCHC-type [Tanacetum cinerariifolium]
RGRGRSGSYHQREGSQGASGNQDKSRVQCYNCQEYGHYASECKNPRRERNHENNLIREHHNAEPALLLSTFKSNGDSGRVLLNEENVTLQLRTHCAALNRSRVWYLDTGASNHMTGDKYKFKNLNEIVQGYVKFRNEIKVKIKWKGSIVFQCKNREQRKLDEVYYIPDLCSNIISLGQLAERGDKIKIKDPFLWVYDGTGKLLMKVHRSLNCLYKIKHDEVRSTCLIAQISNLTWLWHTRMRHVNFNSLKFMSDKNLIEGMPKMYIQTLPCEGCLMGKQTRKTYLSHTSFRENKRLELVHGDLCGPISPPTPTGNKYFMLLVDDYSRVIWVYLLKTKDEALEVFKNFRRKVEVETWEKLKVLRTDHGGELYVSRDVIFKEDQVWEWEKSTKVKVTLGMSFTIEGFNTDEFYDDDFESEPNSPQPDQIASQITPNFRINSPSTASSSTSGGAPKRYRLLTNLDQQTEEIGHHEELMMIRSDEEPVTYTEASKRGEWVKAMDSELAFIKKNNTWKLVDLPKNRKPIGLKWVYKVKRDPTKNIVKYKARIVAKGCAHEYSVYTKKEKGDILIVGVYVDNLLVTGSCHKSVQNFKRDMNTKFEMSDLGLLTYYLGIEVSQLEDRITLKQEAYAKNLLIKNQMLDCNPTKNPMEHKLKLLKEEGELVNPTEYRSIVRGLRYLTHTRPDISFAVGIVSRFMEKPTVKHLQAVKRILRIYGSNNGSMSGNLVEKTAHDQGAEFIHAKVNIKLQDILTPNNVNVKFVDGFIPSNKFAIDQFHEPLLTVQVTMFECGEAGNAETSEELADLLTNNVKKTI